MFIKVYRFSFLGLFLASFVFLSPSVQADDDVIEKAKNELRQKQIQRDFDKLLNLINTATETLKKINPAAALRLEIAKAELEKCDIPEQMEQIVKYIANNGKFELSKKMKILVNDLQAIMNLLILDRETLNKMFIKKVVKKLKEIKDKQSKLNEAKKAGKDVTKKQNDLKKAVSEAKKELGKVSDDSEFKEAVNAAQKDLGDAEKAMEEAIGESEKSEQKPGEPGKGKKGQKAEKKLKEAITKIEKAKKDLEKALKESEEASDGLIEEIRKELRRMIVIQKKHQVVMEGIIEKSQSKRVVRKKLAKQLPIIEQQILDLKRLQLGFEEEGSITFEMVMGMIAEDETALQVDMNQGICNQISLMNGQNVIEGLEDMLEALKDLEPLEGGT